MSIERVLLKEIMIYFAKGDITIRKFENSGDIAETFHSVQELLAQSESTAGAVMPNGVCVSNVYDAYEEGRKSVMSEQEPLSNEQKSAEAELEQALKDTIDEERIRQIMINCISFN
jgi:hypothetical protein